MWRHLNTLLQITYSHCGKQMSTHWSPVSPICIIDLGHYSFSQWLVTCVAPSHYLGKWWPTTKSITGNKRKRHFVKILQLYFNQMYFKLLSAKFRPFCPVAKIPRYQPRVYDSSETLRGLQYGKSLQNPFWTLISQILISPPDILNQFSSHFEILHRAQQRGCCALCRISNDGVLVFFAMGNEIWRDLCFGR